jgi:type III pantothenate kinase
MRLGFLVGNSRLRLALLDGAEVRDSAAIAWDRLSCEGRGLIAERLARRGIDGVVAGSVRDDLLARLIAALPAGAPRVLVARRDFAIPVENLYERPEEAGTDRLLNALAARERFAGQSVIVVDFGTALSLSVVSAAGAFAGGLIGFGEGAVLEALRRATPRLPEVEPRPDTRAIQRATRAALAVGTHRQLTAGVRALVRALLDEVPPPARVIATGGDAERYAGAIPEIEAIDADLTLRGLAIASLAACGRGGPTAGGRG